MKLAKIRSVSLKTYLTTVLLVALISIGATSYVLSQSSGQTITIQPASFTETASYIIFKVGDTIYAKNGTTGEIEYSGTNAISVIQSAINSLTNGGTIYIAEGTYSLSSYIEISNNFVEIIMSPSATLYSENTANSKTLPEGPVYFSVIVAENKHHIKITGGRIIGVEAGTPTDAIVIINCEKVWIEDVYIENCRNGDAIYIDKDNSEILIDGIVYNYSVTSTTGNAGIDIFNNKNGEISVSNCKIYGGNKLNYGMLITDSSNIQIVNLEIHNCLSNGIWIEGYNTYSYPSSNATITNIIISGVSNYQGLRITNATDISISNCVISDVQSNWALYIDGSQTNYIQGVNINTRTCSQGIKIVEGSNIQFHLCWNGTSWIP